MLHLLQERGLTRDFKVDSAGTAAYHVGERPDQRSQAAANRRGVHLPGRARRFERSDFERFDYVLAMDRSNHSDLLERSGGPYDDRLHLLRDFDPTAPKGSSVPDPYYGGTRGFEEVLDMCFRACDGLIDHAVERYALRGSP
jgi:protein-tyrosine phosphatase